MREEWRQIVSGGGLLAAVLAIVVLGAVRETPEAPARPASPVVRAELLNAPPSPAPARAPAPASEASSDLRSLDPLALRTLKDPTRLARSSGSFTLQLAVACRTETASRVLQRAGGSDRLYVLPATVKDQECYRLCWGSYPSREEALKAADLPAALCASIDRPSARRIEELKP